MPLTVITLTSTPPSLRGDLTKWMQEINTGVYVGNFNSKIREKLWQRVVENIGNGQATICYASRNEIGYNIQTHNTQTQIIDADGIPLVSVPNHIYTSNNSQIKPGFSRASHYRKAKKFTNKQKSKDYVILDIETTGLDFFKDKIIEIAALKISDGKTEEFDSLIKLERALPTNIQKLTGIEDKEIQQLGEDETIVLSKLLIFIEDMPIVTYGNNFDIGFLNQALLNNGLKQINNTHIDLMRLVKKENRLLKDYKLQTVLSAYNIDKTVTHRALEDARLTYELANKVNIFKEKMK